MLEQLLQFLKNPIVLIIVVLLVFSLITWLVKSLIKAAFIVVIFYVFFKVLFVWTPEEFTQNLQITKIFKPDIAEKVTNGYSDFYEKREENNPINTDYIDGKIKETKYSVQNKVENTVSDIISELEISKRNETPK